MARVLGVDIPDNKRGEVSLAYIFGIGRSSANEIFKQSAVNPDKRVADWTDEDLTKIRRAISENYKVEGDLKSEIRLNIKRLIEIGSYRGKRHQVGLPSRGQKTKNNARTRKGKKKTVANKKKVTK